MLKRAHSLLEIKAVDEERREITGIATTPAVDSYGDVVEPKGAEFKLPIPFLWQHNASQPIGHVTNAKSTKEGIEVTVKLVKTDEPGTLKNRLDEAWQSIKLGLVRGLSIGFQSIEHTYLEESRGVHFLRWLWVELSAVTIPANSEATITAIKSIDSQLRAASGHTQTTVVRLDKPAGVSAAPQIKQTLIRPKEGTEMNIQEQIKAFETSRAAKAARMAEIMEKAGAEGVTLDKEQADEHDELAEQIEAIDKHLKRLGAMEKLNVSKAKAVTPEAGKSDTDAAAARDPQIRVTAKAKAPGVAFAQYAKCVAISHITHRDPVEIARKMYSDDNRIATLLEKAAVSAATTGNATWAGALVGDETAVFADFVEFLRPQTILGRFGANGVPSLRQVPFRVPLIGQTSGGSGYWVGEGKAKPLTKFDFARTTLEPLKVANIAVATKEVLRDSSPSADLIIRDSLAAALRERLDIDFIDPNKAAAAGVSPASVLNGVTGIVSGGTDADSVRCDVKALFDAFIAENNAPTSGVWIMAATTALALSLMQNPLGQSEFPGIGMNGGTFFGLPVIVSQYVPSDSNGSIVALVNASDIYLADDGGISVDMSTEASLQMDDAPTNASDTPTATSLVSLWQTNSVGFLAERTVSWARRRTSAVAYLTGVLWGACAA